MMDIFFRKTSYDNMELENCEIFKWKLMNLLMMIWEFYHLQLTMSKKIEKLLQPREILWLRNKKLQLLMKWREMDNLEMMLLCKIKPLVQITSTEEALVPRHPEYPTMREMSNGIPVLGSVVTLTMTTSSGKNQAKMMHIWRNT